MKIISNVCPKLSYFNNFGKPVSTNSSLLSKYLDAVKQYLNLADSKKAVVDAFISGFASAPEAYLNDVAAGGEIDVTVLHSYVISEETAELLLSGLKQIEQTGSSTLTFTDSNGVPFSFIAKETVIDGCTSYIQTQSHCTSLLDSVLYVKDGDWMLNPIIRMSEYVTPAILPEVQPSTLFDMVNALATIANASVSVQTIDGLLNAIIAAVVDGYDASALSCFEKALFLCTNILTGVSYEISNFQDFVNLFYDLAVAIVERKGLITRAATSTIYSLINSLVVNNELIDVIRESYHIIESGRETQLPTLISSMAKTKTASLRGFCEKIISGYCKSGSVGALAVVTELIQSLFSSRPSGYSVFNTNQSIPQAFSAGFIATITAIGETLFNVLSSVFNPIISLIGAIGASIFNTIQSVISADISQEFAQVGDLDEVENIAPYTIAAKRVSISEAAGILNQKVRNDNGELVNIGDLLKWSTLDGKPVLKIEYFSCIVKMGYADPVFSDDGNDVSATELVINIYPSVNDCSDILTESDCMSFLSFGILQNPTMTTDGLMQVSVNSSGLINHIRGKLFGGTSILSRASFVPAIANDEDGTYAGIVYYKDALTRSTVCRNAIITIALMMMSSTPILGVSFSNFFVPIRMVDLLYIVIGDNSQWNIGKFLLGGCMKYATNYPVANFTSGGVNYVVYVTNSSCTYEYIGHYFSQTTIQLNYRLGDCARALLDYRNTLFYDCQLYKFPCIISGSASYIDRPYFTAPKYTRGSVVRAIIIGAAIVALATAVIVVSSVTAKRIIQKQRALRSAKIESAWDDLKKNPTAQNYSHYRSLVKSNNRINSIFGGTKYDFSNYWNGDASRVDTISALSGKIYDYYSDSEATTTDLPVDTVGSVIQLIKG